MVETAQRTPEDDGQTGFRDEFNKLYEELKDRSDISNEAMKAIGLAKLALDGEELDTEKDDAIAAASEVIIADDRKKRDLRGIVGALLEAGGGHELPEGQIAKDSVDVQGFLEAVGWNEDDNLNPAGKNGKK